MLSRVFRLDEENIRMLYRVFGLEKYECTRILKTQKCPNLASRWLWDLNQDTLKHMGVNVSKLDSS